MADDGGVAAKLAGAKKTLDDVAHSNVSPVHSPFAPKPNEFSHAPYTMAKGAGKTGAPTSQSTLAGEANSAGAGIAERLKNESAAKASLQ